MREKHRLTVSESRLLKRIYEPKSDKVTREWKKLCNEELSDLSTTNIIQGSNCEE